MFSSHAIIPNNQEVFTDIENDTQLIIEIVEYSDISDAESAAYYFNDLAEQNESTDNTIISTKAFLTAETPHLE